MVTLNLIAWRKAAVQYQQKRFKQVMLHTFLLSVMVILSMQGWMYYQYFQLQARVLTLKNKVDALQFWRAGMQGSHSASLNEEVLSHLRQYQLQTHTLITSIMNSKESQVCFSRLARKGKQISIIGETRSSDDLMHFIESWPAATLFTDIRFLQLKQMDNRTVKFHFVANERYPAFNS